jgi:ComF family protein
VNGERLLRGASLVFASLYEFLFTPVCCHCQAPLEYGERFLCVSCRGTLLPVDPEDSLYQGVRDRLTGDGDCDGLISLYRFEKGSPIQSLIHELKYGGRMGVGLFLGERLGEAVGSLPGAGDFGGCVPVPLHRVRKRERGYNQSALLCRGLSEAAGIPACPSILKRVRPTPSQTALGIEERATNVEGAFALRNGAHKKIAGGSFLLVDDVLTTGATMRACARILKRGGAKRVVACSVSLAA